jgi:hypothetical protein
MLVLHDLTDITTCHVMAKGLQANKKDQMYLKACNQTTLAYSRHLQVLSNSPQTAHRFELYENSYLKSGTFCRVTDVCMISLLMVDIA